MRSDLEYLRDRICAGDVTMQELRCASAEDVFAIKMDQELVRYRFMAGGARLVAKAEDARTGTAQEMDVWHDASTEDRDAVGDVVRARGIDLAIFKTNPQMLFNHSRFDPVGTIPKAGYGRSARTGSPSLITGGVFHTEEENPRAQIVARLVKAGKMPGSSIGFRAKDIVRPKDDKERIKLNVGPFGVYIRESDLRENSIATLPMNAAALKRSIEQLGDTGEVPMALVRDFLKGYAASHHEAEQMRRKIMVSVPELPASTDPVKICAATTKSGHTCASRARKGEQFCGIHAKSAAVLCEVFDDGDLESVLVKLDEGADDTGLAGVINALGDVVKTVGDRVEAIAAMVESVDKRTENVERSLEDVGDQLAGIDWSDKEYGTRKGAEDDGAVVLAITGDGESGLKDMLADLQTLRTAKAS